jgi:3-oxoacyl-[acyl-carrier-protein] synthase II
MCDRRRVVVTGLGAVTPIGNDLPTFWQNLVAGMSGVTRISKFDPSACQSQVAAEIKGLDYGAFFDRKEQRRTEDFAKNAIIAAREAARQSGILESGLDHELIGCTLGVGVGGISFIEDEVTKLAKSGPSRVSPLLIPKIIANIAPGQLAIDLNLKGPSLSVVTACAAGTHAIGEAAAIIQRGDATAIFSGGTEAAICQVAVAGFGNMQALSTDFNDQPEKASRPFDAKRCGFVIGEGAAVMVLEDYDHAKARGATMLAEILGYGLTTDAYHITAPSPNGEGGARAMKLSIKRAGLRPEDIDYVNAHGTSTPLNDKNETAAMKTAFGEHAYKVPVSSNKSMIGHLLGAAGAVEAVATIMTIRNGIIPPTINLEYPDPDCDLDYVPNKARKATVRNAMSNSLGFGGHNSSVIFGACDGQ